MFSRTLPQALPEALSGVSPLYYLSFSEGDPSLVVIGLKRRSKVSNTAISSRLERGF
jgi:hypothetical protein